MNTPLCACCLLFMLLGVSLRAQKYGEKLTPKRLAQFITVDTTEEGILVCSKGGKETRKFLTYYPKEVIYFYTPQVKKSRLGPYKLAMLMYIIDYYFVKEELIRLLGNPRREGERLIWRNGKEQITYIVRPQAPKKEEDYAIFVHLK
jgi:hypothetical protein